SLREAQEVVAGRLRSQALRGHHARFQDVRFYFKDKNRVYLPWSMVLALVRDRLEIVLAKEPPPELKVEIFIELLGREVHVMRIGQHIDRLSRGYEGEE